MKNLGYLVVAVMVIGCGADATPPTVSGVFPSSAFLGRDVRVEVSGDATNWKDGATVSFGPDVTVNSVTVSSPTSLFADVTVKDAGTPGLNDVVVTDSGKSFTMSQSFELKSAIALTSQGTMAQGSVVFLTIQNHDFDTPFDATTDANGAFINTVVTGPAGTTFQISAVDAFSISAAMLIDIDATSGDLSVQSGAPGATVTSSLGANVTIAARSSTALTVGANMGTETDSLGTELFDFTPTGTGPLAVTALATTANASANPMMIILTSSGKFSDGFELFPVTGIFGDVIKAGFGAIESTPQKMFVIYWDNSGTSGYQFAVHTNSVALTSVNEVATNNDTGATAQALAKAGGLLNNATLSSVSDVDVIKVTGLTAADVGKHIHVITQGDPLTDTLVDVFTDVALTTSLGESNDADFQEDFLSDPIPSGTTQVFIKISASQQGFFDPTHNAYVAGVFLE